MRVLVTLGTVYLSLGFEAGLLLLSEHPAIVSSAATKASLPAGLPQIEGTVYLSLDFGPGLFLLSERPVIVSRACTKASLPAGLPDDEKRLI